MSQVIKLLRKKHCDPETLRPYYMVYNLCSEYVYDPKHFENNVKRCESALPLLHACFPLSPFLLIPSPPRTLMRQRSPQ